MTGSFNNCHRIFLIFKMPCDLRRPYQSHPFPLFPTHLKKISVAISQFFLYSKVNSFNAKRCTFVQPLILSVVYFNIFLSFCYKLYQPGSCSQRLVAPAYLQWKKFPLLCKRINLVYSLNCDDNENVISIELE